jgi:ribosome-associated protein
VIVVKDITIKDNELHFSFICAPGPGGQNVNKVATAVLLRFNVVNSPSLPEEVRGRLMNQIGNKLNHQGELIIKATRHRTQERNKQDAIARLRDFIIKAAIAPKKRKATKPTYSSVQKRLQKKKLQGKKKSMRSNQHD